VKANEHNLATAFRGSSSLAGIAAALWLLLAGPVFWWKGTTGLEGLSYAALLCLIPGCLVLVLSASFVPSERPATQMMIPLVGTALRLVLVLVGVLAICELRPELGFGGFLVWVIVFYFAILAAETRILLKKPTSSSSAS
jgi:hypothetical protein